METNKNLEERLDKHGSELYALEQLDIPYKLALHQCMYEDESYDTHQDHKNLFDALQKLLECDHSDQLASDLKEACLKKRKKRAAPRTPSRNDQSPYAESRKDWWKPLPVEEKPTAPEPA
ncbi:hypothetical protein Tco_0005402 [Tanacetum coccineum]